MSAMNEWIITEYKLREAKVLNHLNHYGSWWEDSWGLFRVDKGAIGDTRYEVHIVLSAFKTSNLVGMACLWHLFWCQRMNALQETTSSSLIRWFITSSVHCSGLNFPQHLWFALTVIYDHGSVRYDWINFRQDMLSALLNPSCSCTTMWTLPHHQ